MILKLRLKVNHVPDGVTLLSHATVVGHEQPLAPGEEVLSHCFEARLMGLMLGNGTAFRENSFPYLCRERLGTDSGKKARSTQESLANAS